MCDLPFTDVKPAIALPVMMRGSNIILTARASASGHSMYCSARMLLWLPTSDDEHAVSKEAHGPCRPSANEIRPHVTEQEKPVDEYTLRPAGRYGTCSETHSSTGLR